MPRLNKQLLLAREYHSRHAEQGCSHKTCQKGLTLLEMMITLSIIAIVMTVVAPNVQSILIKNKIVAEINELSAVVQFARNTAIDEQTTSVVCPSVNFTECTNNWDDPKIVFIDENGNLQRDADEEILVATSQLFSVNNLTGPNGPISFNDTGAAITASTLQLCHNSNAEEYARAITISLQGRVKMSRDSNRDNVHENDAGIDLSCPG